MNAHWLRSFEVVVELGSFTRAAERLGLTQAAVSQHVKRLEERLGALLVRHARGIELTPAGAALLEYCDAAARAQQRLEGRLADTDARGDVGLISPGSVGLCLYPMLLDLQAARRDLVIRHRFAPDAEVQAAVLDKRFEMGLITFRPEDERLASSRFAEEPLELVVPAGERVRAWDDLERLGHIDHPDGPAMATRLLARLFPGNPGLARLPCRGFSNQIGLILEPVARGFGFTVLPRYARRAFARPDAIRVVEGGHPVVDTLWLIHRSEWPLSARARHVADHLRTRIAALAD